MSPSESARAARFNVGFWAPDTALGANHVDFSQELRPVPQCDQTSIAGWKISAVPGVSRETSHPSGPTVSRATWGYDQLQGLPAGRGYRAKKGRAVARDRHTVPRHQAGWSNQRGVVECCREALRAPTGTGSRTLDSGCGDLASSRARGPISPFPAHIRRGPAVVVSRRGGWLTSSAAASTEVRRAMRAAGPIRALLRRPLLAITVRLHGRGRSSAVST